MLALGNGFGGQRMSSMTSGAHSAKTSYNQSVWLVAAARAPPDVRRIGSLSQVIQDPLHGVLVEHRRWNLSNTKQKV